MTAFRLIIATFIGSYRQTKFAIAMLVVALLTGAIGLSAVLGLQQVNAPTASSLSFIQPKQFHIVSGRAGHAFSLSDYQRLKRTIGFPMVGFAQNELQIGEQNIKVFAVDSFALMGTPLGAVRQQSSRQALVTQGHTNNKQERQGRTEPHENATHLPTLIQALTTGKALVHPAYSSVLGDDTLTSLGLLEQNWLANEAVPEKQIIVDLSHTTLSIAGAWISLGDYPASQIASQLPAHLELIAPQPDFTASELSNSFQLNLLAMGLLMFAVCLFIVINATHLLLHKRQKMLLVLRQLGFGRVQIVMAQIAELLLISLVCCCMGVWLGYEAVKILTSALNNVLFVDTRLTPTFFQSLLWVSIITVLGVLSACWLRLLQLKALLGGAPVTENPAQTPQILLVCALSLCLFALGCLALLSALFFKLLGTAALILGLSLLMVYGLPHVIRLLRQYLNVHLHRRSNGHHQQGFFGDYAYRIQFESASALALTNQTRLAFCAFFIAVTSNIAMNIMVDSFRGATQQWLEQRLVAEHYVYVEQQLPQQFYATHGFTREQFVPRYVAQTEYAGQPIQLYSYPTQTAFTDAMAFDVASDDVWSSFTAGESVMVNQQFAYGQNVRIGDEIAFDEPVSKDTIKRKVVGIYYDYGNPSGQVLMPVSHFVASEIEVDLFAVLGATTAQLESLLSASEPAVRIFAAQDLIALSMQAFDKTFVITDALNLITLVVAALSLGCTVSVLLDNSRAQRFLLRSLGFSARSIVIASLGQYLTLTLLACVFAVPAGILIGWVLINEINFVAFYWTYPLQILVGSILPVIGLTILMVLAVVLLPLHNARKQSLTQELAWLE